MTEAELRLLLKNCLTDETLNRKGQLLYSGIDTLRPGRFYFLGFNPAADGTNDPLRETRLHPDDWSAYTKQCWTHKECPGCRKTGNSQHQKRVQDIMSELGIRPEDTFATNLIFVESSDIKDLKANPLFFSYLESCWRVHKKMLARVNPAYIVCLGNDETNSVYSFLRAKATYSENHKKQFARTNLKYRKSFDGTFDLDDQRVMKVKVIGVKHPSRPMSPEGLRGFIEC
jgi:hypothetical protein